MEQTNVDLLAAEITKITGHKWVVEQSFAEPADRLFFDVSLLSFGKSSQLNLGECCPIKPNEKLSMADFKNFLQKNNRKLSSVAIEYRAWLYDTEAEDNLDFFVVINLPLDTALKSGKILADDIGKFSWGYSLDKCSQENGNYYIDVENLDFNLEFSKNIEEYITNKQIDLSNIVATSQEPKDYEKIMEIAKKALINMLLEDDNQSSAN